jgi:hypothetical protein
LDKVALNASKIDVFHFLAKKNIFYKIHMIRHTSRRIWMNYMKK